MVSLFYSACIDLRELSKKLFSVYPNFVRFVDTLGPYASIFYTKFEAVCKILTFFKASYCFQ